MRCLFMYAKLAKKLTDSFVKKGSVKEEEADIYVYGFQLILSSASYALIFIIISILTNVLLASAVFFAGFYVIRTFCGGFHASTYLRCHVLFAANHLAFIALLYLIPSDMIKVVSSILYALCIISILLFAPVDHKNKRFIKNEYRRFRKKSVIYGFVLVLVLLLVIFDILPAGKLLLSHSIGTLSATVSLIAAKIINKYERRNENEEDHG